MRKEMGFKESTVLVRGRGLVLLAFCLLLSLNMATAQTPAPAPAPQPGPQDYQAVIARQAAQVTELDVNGLKVLIKRREGSQTVAIQLYIRGGAGNITTANA